MSEWYEEKVVIHTQEKNKLIKINKLGKMTQRLKRNKTIKWKVKISDILYMILLMNACTVPCDTRVPSR